MISRHKLEDFRFRRPPSFSSSNLRFNHLWYCWHSTSRKWNAKIELLFEGDLLISVTPSRTREGSVSWLVSQLWECLLISYKRFLFPALLIIIPSFFFLIASVRVKNAIFVNILLLKWRGNRPQPGGNDHSKTNPV